MSQEPIQTEPEESPVRDEAVERAFQFFLGQKGWPPSKLARESGVPIGEVHQAAVMGYAPAVATLRRLCRSLGVDLWEFLLMGDLLGMGDDLETSIKRLADRLQARLLDLQQEAEKTP